METGAGGAAGAACLEPGEARGAFWRLEPALSLVGCPSGGLAGALGFAGAAGGKSGPAVGAGVQTAQRALAPPAVQRRNQGLRLPVP